MCSFLDALAEDADPLLWPTQVNAVAHVEMPAGGRAVQFVHEARGFHRAQKEMVPDIFEGQLYA